MRGQHARRQRLGGVVIGIVRRPQRARGRAPARCRRAAGRRDAAASAFRSTRQWWIRRRPRPRRHRRSGRCGPRGRSAHAPRWSARHGPTGSPTAPPPAGRSAPQNGRARPGARGRGSRWCRARRWRDRPPRSHRFSAAPASAGPARTPRPARSPAHRNAPDSPGGGEIADMGDQRIEGRPALGLDRAARPRRDWSASAPRP